jgi:Glycosyltransferase family 87
VSRKSADPIGAFESVGELGLGLVALSAVGYLGAAPRALAPLFVLTLWLAVGQRGRLPQAVRSRLQWIVLGVVVSAVAGCLLAMLRNLAYPTPGSGRSEWDFLAFWIDGRVAASGLDFYDPSSYRALALPCEPSARFRRSIIDVGFRYPPVTMLLFAPLSWFGYSTAYALWDGATLLAIAVCAWVIQGLWFQDYGRWGVVLALLLLLVMRASLATVDLGQSNFLVLLAALLALRNAGRFRGGVYLGLGMMVKPLLAALVLPLLLGRRWRPLMGVAAAIATGAAATAIAFGPGIFSSYAATLPSQMPYSSYVETVRQSLLAAVLRATGTEYGRHSPLANPLFLAAAAVLLSVAVWATLRDRMQQRFPLAYGSWVALAMLLYPGTLYHYALFLLLPYLALWGERRRHPFGFELLSLSTVAVFLVASSQAMNSVVEASLVCWLACVIAMATPNQVASS